MKRKKSKGRLPASIDPNDPVWQRVFEVGGQMLLEDMRHAEQQRENLQAFLQECNPQSRRRRCVDQLALLCDYLNDDERAALEFILDKCRERYARKATR